MDTVKLTRPALGTSVLVPGTKCAWVRRLPIAAASTLGAWHLNTREMGRFA